jgi:hypothetical protein
MNFIILVSLFEYAIYVRLKMIHTGMAAATASKKKIFMSLADLYSAEFPLPGALL